MARVSSRSSVRRTWRCSGRAPKASSKPSSASRATSAVVDLSSIPRSSAGGRPRGRRPSARSARPAPAPSGSNVTTSSMRLRNSGRKAAFAAASMRSSSAAASAAVKPSAALGLARAEVRRHDDDGVGEVHRAALAVGQAPVVEELQQDVPDLGVGLLDLVEQHDAVRAAPHRLGELPAVAVADVAGRRADQPRDRVRLAVLGHVDADERRLRGEQPLGQRLDELGLADARRAEEQERAQRLVLLGQADAGAADGVGDDLDGLLLADDAPVQVGLELLQALELAGDELAHRDPVRAATTAATSRSPTTGRATSRGLGAEALQAGGQRLDARLDLAGVLVGLRLDGGALLGRRCSSSARIARGRRRSPAAARRTLAAAWSTRSIALSGSRSAVT